MGPGRAAGAPEDVRSRYGVVRRTKALDGSLPWGIDQSGRPELRPEGPPLGVALLFCLLSEVSRGRVEPPTFRFSGLGRKGRPVG